MLKMSTLKVKNSCEHWPGKWACTIFLVAGLLGLTGVAGAQEASSVGAEAQANNPLANFTSFNVHNYYIGELTDLDDENANQFWFRFAKPFTIGKANWIMRASLPVNTFPVEPDLDHETGLGDLNLFAAYLIDTGNPAITAGVDHHAHRHKGRTGQREVVRGAGAHTLRHEIQDIPVRLPVELARELFGR